ncbi:MAG: GtrA family protein [Variovorax sp.]|nr:GtrA family protein [Variovorax sp.]
MRIGREFLSFAIVGALGFVVDVGVLYLASPHLGWYGGRIVSWWVAATATWLLNRHFTFRARPSGRSIALEYAHYMLTMAGGALVNYAAYVLTLRWAGGAWGPALGVAVGSCAGLAVNFLSARYLVFRAARRP